MTPLADEGALAISSFLVFLAGCLFLAMLNSPDLQDGADDFFTEQGAKSPLRQGMALTGDFVVAAGVLYLCGIVAVASYDGVLVIAAAALSPLLLKVWLAERLPTGPGWSLGDVLARRLPAGPARRAAGVATLTVSVPLLVAQFVPVGQVTAALIGLPGQRGEMAGIALVGTLILACAAIGGIRGSTLLQVVKAVGFLLIGPVLALVVLARFDWDYGEVLAQAAQASGAGDAYLAPGRLFGSDFAGRLDTLSLAFTVLLGTAFLPHLVMRLSSSGTAENARRASSWAVTAICLLCVTAVVIGYGMQAIVGAKALDAAGPRGGNNLLLLAAALDGSDPDSPGMLLTFISCAAVLAVLATASVLLLAGSAAIVHDMGRERHFPAGTGTPHRPRQARLALLGLGALCVALAVFGRGADAQFWLTLAYTEAATVVLPALACSLTWRGPRAFTLRGLRWCVYGGTAVTLGLLALSPAVSGSPDSLYPDGDWAVFPLYAPGLLSVPVAFLLAWAGTRLTPAAPPASPAAPSEPQRPGPAADLLSGSGASRR